MPVPLRFGYKASAEQFGPAELLDYAIQAEEAGFDSVFISDHLQPWLHEGGHAFYRPSAHAYHGPIQPLPSRLVDLEASDVLGPGAAWQLVSVVAVQEGSRRKVLVPAANGNRYFRLHSR